jgi:ABC-2 type transport system permease protein
VSLLNPVVYLVSGFRWSFYEHGDVSLMISVTMIATFIVVALGIIAWMFKTGYRLRK